MPETFQAGPADVNRDTTVSTMSPAVNWEDPSIPVGDSPPLRRWPVVAWSVAWGAWVVFLIWMMLSRIQPGG